MIVKSYDGQHDLHVRPEDDHLVVSLDGTTRFCPTFRIQIGALKKLLRSKTAAESLLSSNFDAWNTPAEVVDPIKKKMGPIGLDPCSNRTSIVGALVEWIFARDGDSLVKPWGGYGLVYVNHPYGHGVTSEWAAKCAAEGAAGTELIQLCKATMGTKWFREHTRTAAVILQWHGRLKHPGPTASGKLESAPFESALAYWGPRADLFMETFKDKGDFVKAP
jgi:hypothetical protein